MITQERLKELLHYNPETGIFTWLKWKHGRRLSLIAGSQVSTGYISIYIDGHAYYAHRLAWLYVYGYTPMEIDHDDRVKWNNQISNLLDVTRSENMLNQKLSPDTGIEKLVSGSFRVKMGNKTIGTFKSVEEARKTYANVLESRRRNVYAKNTDQLVRQLD